MKISETVEFLHEVGGVTIRLTLQQRPAGIFWFF